MKGFHPQNFADGGEVSPQRQPLPLLVPGNGPRGQMAPQIQRRPEERTPSAPPPQKAAPVAAPAAENAISSYAGGGALKRREAEYGLKNGGVVHGPGTGTSDSIPKKVQKGSYIMPADSTQQIGPDALQAMGFRPGQGEAPAAQKSQARGFRPAGGDIPVNVSNGEYEFTPDQVHAVGLNALDKMRNATHQPVPEGPAVDAKNFEHGGSPGEDDPRNNPTVAPITAPSGNAQPAPVPAATGAVDMAPVAATAPAPKPTPTPTPAAPGDTDDNYADSSKLGAAQGTDAAPKKSWTTLSPDDPNNVGMNQIRQAQAAENMTPDFARMIKGGAADVSDKLSAGQYSQAGGALASTIAAGVVGAPVHAAWDAAKAVATPAWGFTKGLFHIDDSKPATPAATPATQAATTKAATPTTPQPNQTTTPTPQQPAEKREDASIDKEAPNNITKVGNNSYSGTDVHGDNFTINGKAPGGGGGTISAQNMAAADALDANHAAMRQASLQNSYQPGGFSPSGPSGSIADPRERQRIMDAALTPLAGSPGQLTANQLRVAQGLYTSDQSNATTRYNTDSAARTAAAHDATELTRQNISEQGQNARTAASNQIQRGELGIRQQSQDIVNKRASQMQSLYDKYSDPNTTEDQKTQIAEQMAILNGQTVQPHYATAGGGQVFDPQAGQLVTQPGVIYNTRTGLPMQGQAGGQKPVAAGNPEVTTKAEYEALPKGAKYTVNGVTKIKE